MKYIKEIYDKLSQGAFLCANSTKEDMQSWYTDVLEHQEEYYNYYKPLGLLLTEGDGYFYFTRKEKKQELAKKIERFQYWIYILDFLKHFDSSLGPGSYVSKTRIFAKMDSDLTLTEKATKIANSSSGNHDKMVENILTEMAKMGFVELVSEMDGRYKVTSAYQYLEDMVNLITINDDGE